MAFFLDKYEKKYGRLVMEDFVKPEITINNIYLLMVIFAAAFAGSVFLLSDFSHHRTLSQVSPILLKGAGMTFFVIGGYGTWTLRSLLVPHGHCLFEKGLLFPGAWGFDDEDDFLAFKDIDRILIAPSRRTAERLYKGVLTAGFGEPLNDGYSDWAYLPTELENMVRSSLGEILFVRKQRFFDYDCYGIPCKKISNNARLTEKLKELAGKTGIPFVDDGYMPDEKVKLKPIVFKTMEECEKEFGRLVYPDFAKGLRSNLFEGGILRWAKLPLEPESFSFWDFRNVDAILVRPTQETASRFKRPVDQIYSDHAPPDRKKDCELDLEKTETAAIGWGDQIMFIFKLKRADHLGFALEDLKDPSRFIETLKQAAGRHCIQFIDESHLTDRS